MSAPRYTFEAKSAAAFVAALMGCAPSVESVYVATENGEPWAAVRLSPLQGLTQTAFPVFPDTGSMGDTSKRGMAGTRFIYSETQGARHSLSVIVERARRMALL